MLNKKVIKHTRKVLVSRSSTCPLLNLPGAKIICVSFVSKHTKLFSFFLLNSLDDNNKPPGITLRCSLGKIHKAVYSELLHNRTGTEKSLLASSRSQIQTLIWGRCIYMSGTIPTSVHKISSKESLRSSDKKNLPNLES